MKKDIQIEQIQELIIQFTTGNFSAKGEISGKNDELDAIVIGLNTMSEEVQAIIERNANEERTNRILEVLLKNTQLDFDEKIEIGENGDVLDAIGIGLNTMGEEFEFYLSELKKSKEKIAASNKELEAFTYSVSHDLRAPLRAIDGYSKVLVEDYLDKLDDEGKRTLKIIMKNAIKMGNLIDDLLAFSRIGSQELIKVNIDMNALTHSIVKEMEPHYLGREIDIDIKPLINAKGDSGMIRQAMTNLLSNAFKYSGTKEKSIIEIGSYQDHDTITYYVKDNGVGFDMQYYAKLFGVFQRLHTLSEFEGTGVGLSIVHRIITKHEGKVWAESTINEGATFYFSLPNQLNLLKKKEI